MELNILQHKNLLTKIDKKGLKRYFLQRVGDYAKKLGIVDKKHLEAFSNVCPAIMYDYLMAREKRMKMG